MYSVLISVLRSIKNIFGFKTIYDAIYDANLGLNTSEANTCLFSVWVKTGGVSVEVVATFSIKPRHSTGRGVCVSILSSQQRETLQSCGK